MLLATESDGLIENFRPGAMKGWGLGPEYSAFGAVRGAAGSALPGIAPSNACRGKDTGYALIAGNGDSIFKRLMGAIGHPDLGADPELADNAGRVAQVDKIDEAIGQWAAQRTVDEVLATLDAVLLEMGLSPEHIKTLRDQGIVSGGMK